MNVLTRKHWPLFCVMVVYWITVIVLIIISSNINKGHFIYPLDDTYIHMSIAKNFVRNHVWGVTRYEFTSSTSSPLYTLILTATYLAFGVNEKSPLILNFIFGTLVILVSYNFLTKYINGRLRIFVILLVAVFVTPLPVLTLAGMEHVLHALLSLYFVYLSILTLSQTKKSIQRYYILLIVLALFVTTVRYEGIFLVFVVCVLFLIQRRVFHAVTLGIIALSPVIIYGIWSVAHGWYFLPNPVLLKGNIPSSNLLGIINLLGFRALILIIENSHILILLIASLFFLRIYYLKREKTCDDIKYANVIFIGVLFLHMQFASTGWFYRYEAYLVLLGIVVISIAIDNLSPKQFVLEINKEALPYYAVAMLLILVIAIPFGSRTLGSLIKTPQATKNIYEQQYQMGTFLKQFYQGKTIAANDIGAVTYLADIQLIDLWGLGSMGPARLKLQKQYTTQQIYDLTRQRDVKIAIVYDNWFDGIGGLPQQWVRVGQWSISNNVVCGGDTVSLYAVDPSASHELMQNLRKFAIELPLDVKQYGKYTGK